MKRMVPYATVILALALIGIFMLVLLASPV